jgi:hypothetical protein
MAGVAGAQRSVVFVTLLQHDVEGPCGAGRDGGSRGTKAANGETGQILDEMLRASQIGS